MKLLHDPMLAKQCSKKHYPQLPRGKHILESIGKWINKMRYKDSVEYLLSLRKQNTSDPCFAMKWHCGQYAKWNKPMRAHIFLFHLECIFLPQIRHLEKWIRALLSVAKVQRRGTLVLLEYRIPVQEEEKKVLEIVAMAEKQCVCV